MIPSDRHPDRPRLVAEPEQRLDPTARPGEVRQEPRLFRAEPRPAGEADADLRIGRIGSAEPLTELDHIDGEVETDADLEDEEDREDAAPRRRWLPIATAVLALLGFAGIVWYAYQWGVGSVTPEELPVIRAEDGPSKIRPESPGGLEVPYQETLALNPVEPDPEKPQVERLLPPPETPMAPPTSAVPAAPPAAPPAAAEAAAPQAPAEPAPTPVPEAAPEPAAPEPAAPQTAARPIGDFVLQLASLKAKERAPVEWARLQKNFPALLGDRQLVVLPVDLGGRGTFYRVQAGFFPDRASANAACTQLKAKRQDCLVTKR